MKEIAGLIRTYQKLILAAVILGGSLLGFFLGELPAMKKAWGLVLANRTLSEEIRDLRSKNSLLGALDEETLRQHLMVLTLAVPADKSLPTLFSTIEGLGQETDLSIDDLVLTPGIISTEAAKRSQPEENKFGSSSIPFTVTVEGTFAQLQSFLQKAVGVRRLIRVRNFSAAFDSGGLSRVTLSLETFYLPFPTTLGDVTDKLTPLTAEEETLLAKIRALPNLAGEFAPAPAAPATSGGKSDPFSL